ncbi:MAG TPA: aquaporin [Nitrososphaeraceae archaeon]|nr:aquaporin [Nitrososphaeraceae archaeon]
MQDFPNFIINNSVLNPAITVALVVSKNLSLLRGTFYIVFQLLGALVGSFIIKLIHPNQKGATSILNNRVSIAQGFFFEMFTTTVLTMAVLILVIERKESVFKSSFGVGMTLLVTGLCSGPFTGASLNPARTFGTSIIWNDYGRAHWIYYLGPLLGSLLAFSLWNLLKISKIIVAKSYDNNNDNDKVDIESI